jgi:poly(3-hydroxybutyrate) depolymerase
MAPTRKYCLMALACTVALAICIAFMVSGPEGSYAYFSYDYFDDGDIGEMEYALYLPPEYRKAKNHALVVSLHERGKRGNDGREQLTEGLGTVIASRVRAGKHFDFVALFPQSFTGSWHPDSDDGRLLMKLIANVKERYPIDPDRVYLTGLGDGATGVWGLARKYPDQWAAIVPIAGTPNPADAPTIKHIPCWCFHGSLDSTDIVHAMINSLRAAGGSAYYTEYPGRGHNIWLAPYSEPGFFEWLLAQRRQADAPRKATMRDFRPRDARGDSRIAIAEPTITNPAERVPAGVKHETNPPALVEPEARRVAMMRASWSPVNSFSTGGCLRSTRLSASSNPCSMKLWRRLSTVLVRHENASAIRSSVQLGLSASAFDRIWARRAF